MKSVISVLIGATLMLSTITPAFAWRQREYCPPEALTVLRYVAGITVPCVPQDANGDGTITSVDALWILTHSEG